MDANASDLPSIIFYDTSTLPTEEMLDAMRIAPLGDDVYGEDPTVRELESMTAELAGKEASLFLPSGTMANLVAIMAHTQHGDEVVLEEEAHTLNYEAGGMAAIAGCMPRIVRGKNGVLSADMIEPVLRKPDEHYPPTTLVVVENTHNRAGGTIVMPEVMAGLRELADRKGLLIHVDGARIFNAAVALKLPLRELVQHADSICFCLSKGLSCPAGSMLTGSTEFITRARRARKKLGGGMRQIGVLAAAGIVALQTGIDRLAEDNAIAQYMAHELARIAQLDVNPESVQTNIVLVGIARTGIAVDTMIKQLRSDYRMRASAQPPSTIRFVTHRHIGKGEVAVAVRAVDSIVSHAT